MHVIIDAEGHLLGALFTAAHIDELNERLQLLKALGNWKKEGMILEDDRSHTSKSLREQILRRDIYPAIFQ